MAVVGCLSYDTRQLKLRILLPDIPPGKKVESSARRYGLKPQEKSNDDRDNKNGYNDVLG